MFNDKTHETQLKGEYIAIANQQTMMKIEIPVNKQWDGMWVKGLLANIYINNI